MDCYKFYKITFHITVIYGLYLQGFEGKCGIRPLEKLMSRTPLIVGGHTSKYGEIPWQVGLFYNDVYYCGGALIGNKCIVTAGHCAKIVPDLSKLSVRLGEYDLTSDYPKRHIQAGVKSRILHEKFVYEKFPVFDIGLLKLDKPVSYEDNVQSICIPDQDTNITDKMGIIAGWGRKSYHGKTPNVLQMVGVNIINSSVCEEWINGKVEDSYIRDDWICAGYKEGKKDACIGDSGSPLTAKLSDGRWYIVGISSSGFDSCAEPMLPGIYTHVSMFSNWIKKKCRSK